MKEQKREDKNYLLFSDLAGNRTRVYGVRGRRLDRLTTRPWYMLLCFSTNQSIMTSPGIEPGFTA